MVNILPFLGPPRQPAPRRTANGKPEEEKPGFLQRIATQRGGEQGPRRAAGRGIIVPGQQLPHITLNTVQDDIMQYEQDDSKFHQGVVQHADRQDHIRTSVTMLFEDAPNWALCKLEMGGKLEIGAPTGKWQMIVVYRGKHCPVSKNYLASLQQIIYELDELGVEVVAVSGDGRERAEAFLEALKATTETKEVTFKIAYGLPLDEMLAWGLFVSEPRNPRETDQPFPEPALFLLNPDGEVIIIDYSNSPFARPDLRILVEGIRYIQENDYPVRGTYGYY
ncbi:hypothetical protein COCSUDRAFT_45149 [Coccomyxa subellipsoidea C-169]|uniref:Thioredoxin domain-containing protein n=1 Tax=Coccomyxa subellipsoidea (strain C-169) TaxID=574566 RepID=I0YJU4_COCSC|nr:hypothetical protein COCSUDRAFT_45149 [Coccomyxa subellipsoidea C-169]EIE18663.1 hypothetical protein COCSUDRAFT_45149 [Coccomyxa subellipsoidea C-169]|eukprot:XP_005643207.1 hypothetical protein COCSUDRAFT_45149 [Coccomyxa subellipsoidea C-169]